MRAQKLSDLLKKNDRVAVSNITGREASEVTSETMKYCSNIIGGWALGRGGQKIETTLGEIPVCATFQDLIRWTPPEKLPNKIVIYSPPGAVYGEVKEVIHYGKDFVDTIFVITEHVSIEVTAKIYQICKEAMIDILGCNTLGMINVHDKVRVGAVGGNSPEETFKPGSVTVISNSGNMVNTIASYLKAAGMGTAYGISTGKDALILTPMRDILSLTEEDPATKIIVLYVEPGGVYEHEAIIMMEKKKFSKPVVVFVAGKIAEKHSISLGHAGAVIEGKVTTASAKMKEFDDYFGIEPFNKGKRYKKDTQLVSTLSRGIRVNTLHDIEKAVSLITETLKIKRDFTTRKKLSQNPWFVNLGELGKKLPSNLVLAKGTIPEPYASQFKEQMDFKLGMAMSRQSMQNVSHASSNDGATPRVYGYSLMDLMRKKSFGASLVLYWTGELPKNKFEEKLVDMSLIASLTNGPGTISAQGAKLSASAGNSPNTAMISTLASIGTVHGGNGAKAVKYLLDIFGDLDVVDPYDSKLDIKSIAEKVAADFKKKKMAAKEASIEYERIPCIGHPVFNNKPVNYDPREQIIYKFMEQQGKKNIFLEFYHHLVKEIKDNGSTRRVFAVNVDGAIASVWLGICWSHLREKRMTIQRAMDIPFIAFALGRSAGGAGEFLDHRDFGTTMDMRIPVSECKTLVKPRKLG